jgi:hypothetical protein
MSNVGLFIIGTFVSLLVAGSVGLLSWGAVLDGRDERERLRVLEEDAAEQRLGSPTPPVLDAA